MGRGLCCRDVGRHHRSPRVPKDGGSDRDRVIDAQAFAAKQRQNPGEAELEQTWQTLPKAVRHVESDKCRFGNLEASVRSPRRAIEGFRDPGTSLKPD